jgi:hypothetical protein
MTDNDVNTVYMQIADERPDMEAAAAAGADYGRVRAWETDGGWIVEAGNNARTEVCRASSAPDDLLAYLEDDSLTGMDAVVHAANLRGPDSVPEARRNAPLCAVLETTYHYGPTTRSDVVRHHPSGGPVLFGSRAEARRWIARTDRDAYTLAHNESGRPSYRVIDAV